MRGYNMSKDRLTQAAVGFAVAWALAAALAFSAVGCRSAKDDSAAHPFDGVIDPVTERPVPYAP
jgi:hypothetical protein